MVKLHAADHARPADVEQGVLDVVRDLVDELGGAIAPGAIVIDHCLDRDLGLGSLERVELVARLEQAFAVRLPDQVVAADTCRELADAVRSARPAPRAAALPSAPTPGRAIPAPASAPTLIHVLRWHAEAHPDRVHVFLWTDDLAEEPITYGTLWDKAARVAAGLAARGVGAGERVALMLRSEPAFFEAFLGVLIARAIPVPMYPPFRADRLEEYAERQGGILANAEARLMVTFPEAERIAGLLDPRVASLRGAATVDRLIADADRPASGPSPAAQDAALIQYTSGSTGAPKGVLLTHGNLLANIRAFGEAIAIRPDDVAVSWLPLYHDMGLIGAWLGALYWGIPVTILPPLAFIARPARWLRAIAAHRGTVSPAPNFAFDLCERRIADDELQGVDLATWRLALNGSEPVSPETIERFARRFAPHGLRPEAMCPVYGLAECSVALTIPAPGAMPRIDAVDRQAFQTSRQALAVPPEAPHSLRFVGCGRAIPGHDVRIVGEDGSPLGERVEGGIEFRGPSVTPGYWRNPEANRALFRDGWADSGDQGYLADGQLFVTGRRKDIVIKAGRHLYPQEVEEIAGAVPGIRKGCVAAFGVADPGIGTERLIVVAESRDRAAARREALRAAVVARLVEALGLPPDAVLISRPGTVRKTPSGKVRRSAMREAYLRGRLDRARPSPRSQLARLVLRAGTARLRRLPARAGRLVLGAYVGALAATLGALLWATLALVPRARPVDGLVRAFCRAALRLAGCPLRIEGLDRLAGAGPAVLVANHASYLDAVVLLAALPAGFRFVGKVELGRWPLVGTVIRRAGHLTVDRADLVRGVAAVDQAAAALRAGRSVLFFPEGTFVRQAGLLPFRLGAFKTATDAGRPVVPVALRGTRAILPDRQWLPSPGPVTVAVGPVLLPAGTDWHETVRLRDAARAAIAQASGERPVEARPLPS